MKRADTIRQRAEKYDRENLAAARIIGADPALNVGLMGEWTSALLDRLDPAGPLFAKGRAA